MAVIPQRAEPAEGQQAARTQKLAYAQGGFESPTLKLSGATLTSSIGDTGSEIIYSEVWGRYARRTPGAQVRRYIYKLVNGGSAIALLASLAVEVIISFSDFGGCMSAFEHHR